MLAVRDALRGDTAYTTAVHGGQGASARHLGSGRAERLAGGCGQSAWICGKRVWMVTVVVPTEDVA